MPISEPFAPGDRVHPGPAASSLLDDFRGQIGRITWVEGEFVWVQFDRGGYASHVPAAEFERVGGHLP